MKSAIGMYSKVVILSIMIMALIGFVSLKNPNNIFKQMPKSEATVNNFVKSDVADRIQKRGNPTLTISPKQLKAGHLYNLKDKSMFNIISKNDNNNDIPFEITKIIKMKDNSEINVGYSTSFIPERGKYKVTYHNEEVFETVKRETTKTYTFVVD